jgi:hypothetical protein
MFPSQISLFTLRLLNIHCYLLNLYFVVSFIRIVIIVIVVVIVIACKLRQIQSCRQYVWLELLHL